MTTPTVALPQPVAAELEFELTQADARVLARELLRRRRGRAPLALATGASLVALTAVVVIGDLAVLWAVASGGAVAALIAVALGQWALGAAVRGLRDTPGVLGPRRVTVGPDGLVVRTVAGTLEVPWSAIGGVSEVADFVLLEQTPTVVHALPRDAVAGTVGLRGLLDRWVAEAAGTHETTADTARPAASSGVPWGAVLAVAAATAVYAVDQVLGFAAYAVSDAFGDLYFAVGSLLVVCGGVWLAVRRWGPAGVVGVLGRRPRWPDVGAGLVVAAAILMVDAVLMVAVELLFGDAALGDAQGWIDAALFAAPVATAVALVVTGPISEEVLFRGLLFRGLRRRWGTIGAAVASAALFAIVHPADLSAASMVLVVSTFLTGLILAAATVRRGTLVTAIVAHVVVNGIVTALALSAPGMPWVVPSGPGSAVTAYDLDEGACTDGFPDEPVGTGRAWTAADTVACDTQHEVEVYDRWPLGAATDVFPGHHELADEANGRCYDRFDRYVGRDFLDSDLDYLAVVPDAEAWERGARDGSCLLVHLDREPLTGSARDSGW